MANTRNNNTYRDVAEVYINIRAYRGSGGLPSGAPSGGGFDPTIEGLGELYNSYELSSRIELHDQREG